MSDLAEFLLARIAETEAIAFSMERVRPSLPDWKPRLGLMASAVPVYVMAQCEAHRQIVNLHEMNPGHGLGAYCGNCVRVDNDGNPDVFDDSQWPCATLRALAAQYVDHPDYRQEWKPSNT